MRNEIQELKNQQPHGTGTRWKKEKKKVKRQKLNVKTMENKEL